MASAAWPPERKDIRSCARLARAVKMSPSPQRRSNFSHCSDCVFEDQSAELATQATRPSRSQSARGLFSITCLIALDRKERAPARQSKTGKASAPPTVAAGSKAKKAARAKPSMLGGRKALVLLMGSWRCHSVGRSGKGRPFRSQSFSIVTAYGALVLGAGRYLSFVTPETCIEGRPKGGQRVFACGS